MPKYIVRYGSMRMLGVFTASREDKPSRGMKVIARTDRGMESGEVLCEATDAAIAQIANPGKGQILRSMTLDDENEIYRLRALHLKAFEVCNQFVEQLGLDMKLVDVEHLFGGERIIFYYLADQRVDFRELVRKLASEFQTRIEMRQIGVRDESRLLADYGDCGKPVCCNTHLSQMPPVSMKMAKLQRATLDPSKISGRCGRLKCCLRYEYDTYVEMKRELPSVGSTVLTRQGKFRVLSQEILAAQLLVETEDNRRIIISADEVLSTIHPNQNSSKGSSRKSKSSKSSPPKEN
ncbi:Stage 0 sporulation protein YaaT [Planctomycetales bacterium 10988]|nr:Stage 0 sporulation protein YaaT [Planctomycetales bacterium 10988]